jgi:uncharacterized MAPEG superfamily protein
MSTELTLLLWSTTIVGAYILVQSTLYRLQHGIIHAATARDSEPPANVWTARSERALRNLLETYAVFVVLCIATELSGRAGATTAWGAHFWFWSRWAYLPLYVLGVPYVRSLVWTVSAVGLTMMFAGLVL